MDIKYMPPFYPVTCVWQSYHTCGGNRHDICGEDSIIRDDRTIDSYDIGLAHIALWVRETWNWLPPDWSYNGKSFVQAVYYSAHSCQLFVACVGKLIQYVIPSTVTLFDL